MTLWGPIPSTPLPGTPGGVPEDLTGIDDGGVNEPGATLPEVAVQVLDVDFEHVVWLERHTYQPCRRSLDGPGRARVSVKVDDPHLADIAAPGYLRIWHRGTAVLTSLIEGQANRTRASSEESGEDVDVGGQGFEAALDRATVDPLELDLKPTQDAHRFSYAHRDYDDTVTGWTPAVDVSGDPGPGTPENWPGGGVPIWGESGTATFAPGGRAYFRSPSAGAEAFDNPTEQTLAFCWVADNFGELHLDGALIDDLPNIDGQNFRLTHETRLTVSAGVHVLAGSVFQQGPDEPEMDENPGYLWVVVYTLDADGEHDTLLYATSEDWKAYEFPQTSPPNPRPTWSWGEILNWLLDQAEDRGGETFARSFDDDLDTASDPWERVEDWTVDIGPSNYDAIKRAVEAHIDFDRDPATGELHAWNKGGRGTHTGLELHTDTTGTPVSILSLTHSSEPPVANRILARYADAYIEAIDTASIEATSARIERYLDVERIPTAAGAREAVEAALDIFKRERVQYTAELLVVEQPTTALPPSALSPVPFEDFDVGDWIFLPDRDGELAEVRVLAIEVRVDQHGKVTYAIDANDAVLTAEERWEQWLKRRVQGGGFAGRSMAHTPRSSERVAAGFSRQAQGVSGVTIVDELGHTVGFWDALHEDKLQGWVDMGPEDDVFVLHDTWNEEYHEWFFADELDGANDGYLFASFDGFLWDGVAGNLGAVVDLAVGDLQFEVTDTTSGLVTAGFGLTATEAGNADDSAIFNLDNAAIRMDGIADVPTPGGGNTYALLYVRDNGGGDLDLIWLEQDGTEWLVIDGSGGGGGSLPYVPLLTQTGDDLVQFTIDTSGNDPDLTILVDNGTTSRSSSVFRDDTVDLQAILDSGPQLAQILATAGATLSRSTLYSENDNADLAEVAARSFGTVDAADAYLYAQADAGEYSQINVTTASWIEMFWGDLSVDGGLALNLDAGDVPRADFGAGDPVYLRLAELPGGDPAAPGANSVALFAKDNGAGKTGLYARFNTGVVQQVALEP